MNEIYYHNVICNWVWTNFEKQLIIRGCVGYEISFANNITYVNCEGVDFTYPAAVESLIKATGLNFIIPKSTPKYLRDSKDFYENENKSQLKLIDNCLRISRNDRDADIKYNLIIPHYKILQTKKSHINIDNILLDGLASRIIYDFYNAYQSVTRTMYDINKNQNRQSERDLVSYLNSLKDSFKCEFDIPVRFIEALQQGNYYSRVDLNRITYLLSLHNIPIEVCDNVDRNGELLRNIKAYIPTDNDYIDQMIELVQSGSSNLIKAAVIDENVALILKDDLHKKLFSNDSYFKQGKIC